ncbi:MAG: nitrogenase cofactor biosynthesis protein NifB [Rhodoferax sp.]|nr:nitrogenase cofactor biosynthesis protein NifB [Rhodoferax sp.]
MQTSANTGSMPARTYVSIGQIQSIKARLALSDAGGSSGGCYTKSVQDQISCGASDGPDDMPQAIWDKVKDHPCYSEQAHHHFARMHIAVAPACNIQCNYCNRKYDCSNESRPGVVSQKLSPELAVRKVLAVASEIQQLTVVGIAGPGDALANPKKTFDTLRMLQAQAPDLKLCISTNGLALPDLVDELCKYKVDHVTITINMVDPAIGAKIYPWIFWNHKRLTGYEASKVLHERQMLGLEMLTARGVLTKINSVLIPGINDAHLIEVNREVKKRGAFLHNIMPLISEAEHGTAFGLSGQRGPSAAELKAVQDACMGGAKLMRHCRQCRADAVGLLGEDRSDEFSLDKLAQINRVYDIDKRHSDLEKVAAERDAQQAARQSAKQHAQAAAGSISQATQDLTVLVAVATKGGGRVNEHFGHVTEFQVFEVSAAKAVFVGHRRVDQYCQGGAGDDGQLPSVVRAINDCHAVLVAKIGACPRDELTAAGVEPVERYVGEFIEKAALDWFGDYRARIASGAAVHQNRGDARIRQGAYTHLADGVALAA